MKLLLRRDQRNGMLGGKPVFMLDVRAEISAEEKANIAKYRLGETQLWGSHDIVEGTGILGAVTKVALKAAIKSVTVNDLTNGKRVECKDVVEMLAIEGQIREAAATFKQVLDAAAHFGGEEAVVL